MYVFYMLLVGIINDDILAGVRCVWSSVDSQLRVRVTDAALSRDLFPTDYDHQHGGAGTESRPTRWMALESLVDRSASSTSDMVGEQSRLTAAAIPINPRMHFFFLYWRTPQWNVAVMVT